MSIHNCLAGGGSAGAHLRALDWNATPLGLPETWPISLQASIRMVLASAFPMMVRWGPELRTFYNDACAPTIGSRHPGSLGRPAREWWAPTWEQLEPIFDQVLAGKPLHVEDAVDWIMRNGKLEEAYFTRSHSPLWNDQGEIEGILLVLTETTRRVIVERELLSSVAGLHAGAEALRLSEARFVALTESVESQVEERTRERNRMWNASPDLQAVVNAEGLVVDANPAWSSVLGRTREDLVGTPVTSLTHPDDRVATAEALARARHDAMPFFESRIRAVDGNYHQIAWVVAPEDGLTYTFGRDVTMLRRTEELLRQSQKMEAVGQLTGGIAHDFNNMLTGIVSSMDLLKRHLAAGKTEKIQRYIEMALNSAQRAAGLTHRLLAFSRRQSLDVRPTDVTALVTNLEDMLSRTLGEHVRFEVKADPATWFAMTDSNQMENALLNLALNARDAMPNGGWLTVETSNTHLDATYVAGEDDLAAGDYVLVAVSDTGEGMTADVIAKAFDPFFTTKPIGQGTGLGLSMIYGFARQSGGHVRIYSEVGQGTSVKLYLPRHYGDIVAQPARTAATPRAVAGEQVLVVEDDASVRSLVLDVLQNLGYEALAAADGKSALPILDSDERIDLLVTDVGLPGLNGRQVAEIARQKRPGLKVLFITGYAEHAMVRGGFLEPGMEMVAKPFSIDVLASKIRQMIEQ